MTLNQVINTLCFHFMDAGDFTTRQAAEVLNCTVNLASARMIHLANRGLMHKVRPGVFSLDCADEDEMDLIENNAMKVFVDEEHQAWIKSVTEARKSRLCQGQWQQRHS
jgi:hypothetical protein